MKILVTGGAGFIGSNIVDELIKLGHNVFVIDNLSTGKIENINTSCTFIKEDLVTIPDITLDEITKNIDYIFHVSAKARVQPSILEPILFNQNNVDVTLKLLDSARRTKNVKRFIFSSSSSVYGQQDTLPFKEDMTLNPMSPYALQKVIGEQYCKLYSKIYQLDTVCLRYFNVYGNRQPTEGAYCTIIGIFTRQKKNGESLTITNDGNQKRDNTHVSDIVNANILAMNYKNNLNGHCFNIGYGDNISINELASWFSDNIKYIGNVIEPKETLADNSKAKNILGWEPKISLTKEYVSGLF